ncbi:MAG TPA: PilZ domain-containing protein [Thermoanaerobaculia bacterium]|nr:PilZ domain-containing protein [Thermoanaerobaculia bacterium]
MNDEKRRIQRIILNAPIPAFLGGLAVTLVDISTVGARIEHEFPLTGGRRFCLEFRLGDRKVAVQSEVVRCRLQRSAVGKEGFVYNSGLRFADPAEPARAIVRQLVASLLTRRSESQAAV